MSCLVLFCSCFFFLFALRLPRFWGRELVLGPFVRLFDLCLFGFAGFLFLLVSGGGEGGGGGGVGVGGGGGGGCGGGGGGC